MKIVEILNENAVLTFRNLDSMQVSVLKRRASGRLDPDVASPRELATLDVLADMGLVDSYGYELTPQGERVLQIAQKYGSSLDVRDARTRDEKLGREGSPARKYTDVGDASDFDDVVDVDRGVKLKNLDTDVVDNKDLRFMDR